MVVLASKQLWPNIRSEDTDCLPVMDLIAAQWQPGPDATLSSQAAKQYDVVRLAHEGLGNGWNWPRAFQRSSYKPGTMKAGLLFEDFVAAALLHMGVSDVRKNVKLKGAAGKPLQEVDVIANHGGRLVLLDCKIRTADSQDDEVDEGPTKQIRECETTRRSLGGLGARMAMIRPSWRFTEDEQRLAEACGLYFIGPDRAWRLLSELARLVGRPLPESLQQLEDEVLHSKAQSTGLKSCWPLSLRRSTRRA